MSIGKRTAIEIKNNQLAAKLVSHSTSAKTHWSNLKTFATGRNVPVIPPLGLLRNRLSSLWNLKILIF